MTALLPDAGVGLDLGSTLAKVAIVDRGALRVSHHPVEDRDAIAAALAGQEDQPLAVTGAGAGAWAQRFASRGPRVISEFEAAARGARVLLARASILADEPFLVVSVGTGTSVLRVEGDQVTRVGGTALGGGTLRGLGRLLCGTDDYGTLAALAAEGNRQGVDLLVRDVYPGGTDELLGALTAANFGRIASRAAAPDLAHGLCGLLGENLGLICGGLARLHGASQVLYCGGTLHDNTALAGILIGTTQFAGAPAQILPEGTYCAAVGSLAVLRCSGGAAA